MYQLLQAPLKSELAKLFCQSILRKPLEADIQVCSYKCCATKVVEWTCLRSLHCVLN